MELKTLFFHTPFQWIVACDCFHISRFMTFFIIIIFISFLFLLLCFFCILSVYLGAPVGFQ